jgi:predicted TIM-barrel fold metal-dependent hydrolase
LGRSRDGASLSLAEIQAAMDQYGVSRGVLFGIDEQDCGPSYERTNTRVLKAVAREPRLVAFARLNPRAGAKAVAELKRCVQAGARGVKLHPRSEDFSPAQAEELVAEIEKERLPIFLHTSHEKNCRPLEWERLFRRHPKTPFILAHGAKDAFEEAVAVARRQRHVWVETSTLSSWRSRVILRALGAGRVVFGSDLPYSHPAVERLKLGLLLSPSERKKVYSENARRLLGD